jgi:predicted kinase
MQLIMLIGIPGSGKSSFYKGNYFATHMRISLDLLNTRNKEQQFLRLAFALQQRVVIDNTNVSRAERETYILEAKANKYKVTGYYFESKLEDCIARNELRTGRERISHVGVISKYKELAVPEYKEGFDELYYVRIENDEFTINDWNNEI